MKLIPRIIILMTALVFIPMTTFALGSSNAAEKLVLKLSQNKVKIDKTFNATGHLKGFVLESLNKPGQKTIVYADESGDFMFVGAIINSDGQNLTQADYEKYIAAAQSPKIFRAAQKTHWIQTGKDSAPHKAYVLLEPNCIACHMLYKELQPMIASGQLAVRWIFVAFMKPTSMGMVASIMQSKNPAAALAMDENNFDAKTETGGVKPMKNVSAELKEKIKANMTFMSKSGFVATPAIIYKTANGYQIMRGFIKGKMGEVVNSMTGQF